MKNYVTLLLDLPEIFGANPCRYEKHSWKFLLEKTKYKKVVVWYATTDPT